MKEFRFLDWDVYRDSRRLIKEIYRVTDKFPNSFKYDLGSQLNRAATSVTLNIAEGSGKNSDAELNRFFSIAIGSVYEVIAGLDIALDNDIIQKSEFVSLVDEFKNIARQLGNFKKKLSKK